MAVIPDTVNNEEVIDLKQYFKIIKKYQWKILLLSVFVAIFTTIILFKMTPIYSATSTLLIEAEEAKAVSFQEVMGVDASRKEYYLTQFEILKSKQIASLVIQRLNLASYPEFQPKESALTDIKASIKDLIPFLPKDDEITLSAAEITERELIAHLEIFSENLTISPIRKTQLVNISYQSEDPKLAALVANTLGEVYIENHLTAKMGVSREAAGWLTDRLSNLRLRLGQSEERLQQYREQQDLVDVEGVLGLVKNELEQTSAQLVISRNDRNKLESIMRVINEFGIDNIERLESIPEISSYEVIQNVKRAVVISELKVSELKEVFGPKHPRMIAATAELATVRANLRKQLTLLITGIEKEVRAANENVAALEASLTNIRAKYQIVTRKESEYRQLKREVETNRSIYDTFFSRSKETEVTSDFNSAVARFTDKAFTPINPVKPKKGLILALAFIASMGIGVVIAFILDALHDTVKSTQDVENKLTQRMLGILPEIKRKSDADLDLHLYFDKEARQFAESVRTLRTSFVLNQIDKETKIIAITSSIPNEGKTTVSSNMAFALGQMEKVLIIDGDLRKPSICKRFGIPAYHPGLTNLLTETSPLEECLFVDEKSGITIIPSGQFTAHPLELLSSPRFKALLAKLSLQFDRIIIDTAPTQAVSDSLVISTLADAVIYVVRGDHTRMGIVKSGLSRLLESNAKLSGVVLNLVDMSKASDYGYHGYYDYYEYGHDEKS